MSRHIWYPTNECNTKYFLFSFRYSVDRSEGYSLGAKIGAYLKCILVWRDDVLFCVVPCCAVLCCAVLCYVMLCYVVLLYCAVLCCAILCCAVLFCAVLCYAMLCCAVMCCSVLFRSQPYSTLLFLSSPYISFQTHHITPSLSAVNIFNHHYHYHYYCLFWLFQRA